MLSGQQAAAASGQAGVSGIKRSDHGCYVAHSVVVTFSKSQPRSDLVSFFTARDALGSQEKKTIPSFCVKLADTDCQFYNGCSQSEYILLTMIAGVKEYMKTMF